MSDADTLLNQGLDEHRAGRLAAAEALYRRALACDAVHAESWHLLAVSVLQQGRAEEALAAIGRSLDLDEGRAKPWNTLANVMAALGREAEALPPLERAAELDPSLAVVRRNLGNLLLRAGRTREAENHLRAALGTDANDAAAHADLGTVLHRLGRGAEAEAEFRTALRLSPGMPLAHLNLGIRAREAGDLTEARHHLSMVPGSGARLLLGTALPAIPRDEAEIRRSRRDYEACLDHLMEEGAEIRDPLAEIGQTPQFFLACHGQDDRALQEKLVRLLRRLCPSLSWQSPHCRAWEPGRRLRVGFVSSHFHHHTIGKLWGGCVAGLSRQRVETVVFAPPTRDDEWSRRIRAAAESWVHLPPDLHAARTAIAEARCDVLIFPDLGLEPFTWFLAFARLAPIQMTSWGHPVTTGIDTLDWFVSARSVEPEGAQDHYSERLALLERPSIFYHRPQGGGARSRSYFSLDENARLYVCPQTLFKLHPSFDALAAGVLRRDPGGVLVLIEGQAAWRRQVEQRFAAAAPDVARRLRFLPRMSEADFIALCGQADCMLDVPTFSGGNTTLEALSTGTPIVTLPRAFLRGRFTAGLLAGAGLSEGVAAGENDYVAKAVEMAAESARLRPHIRDQAQILYGDHARIREFEAFLAATVETAR